MTRRASLVTVLALCGLALCGLLGCQEAASESGPGACACAEEQGVVDPALLAFLSRARAAHGQADIAEAERRPAEAVRRLEALVGAPRPPGDAPEMREVLADTFARLAELRSAAGSFEPAVKDIDAGLKLAKETTHFRGRLKEVLGLVEKRRYEKLAADGQEAEAAKAKARSIQAFQEAIAIQEAVIQRTLGDGGPAPAMP